MVVVGIGLMALGALGTSTLIWIDAHSSIVGTMSAVVGGLGALALFFAGQLVLMHDRRRRTETVRVDHLADDAEPHARIHLLESRAAGLHRQVEILEARREELIAELAAVTDRPRSTRPVRAAGNLLVLPSE